MNPRVASPLDFWMAMVLRPPSYTANANKASSTCTSNSHYLSAKFKDALLDLYFVSGGISCQVGRCRFLTARECNSSRDHQGSLVSMKVSTTVRNE